MKGRAILVTSLACGLVLILAVGFALAESEGPQGDTGTLAAPVGTSFTYQGRLTDGGDPADGSYDFEFTLYDDPTVGDQVGSTVPKGDETVTDGLFTVQLDFGGDVFTGDDLWLEIGVRPGDSSGAHTTLGPRQRLTATPYAHYALKAPWSGLTGIPEGFKDGEDDDTTYMAGTGLNLVGAVLSADTTTLQRRVSGSCGSGNAIRVIDEDGTVTCESVGGGVDPHDHLGETWTGNTPLTISGSFAMAPLVLNNGGAGAVGSQSPQQDGDGLRIQSAEDDGVQIDSAGDEGVFVVSAGEDGVLVESAGRDAFSAVDAGGDGLYVKKAGDDGVDVREAAGDGVYVGEAVGTGVYVGEAGQAGVRVGTTSWEHPGLHVEDAGGHGVLVESAQAYGLQVIAAGDGVNIEEASNNGVRVREAGGDGVRVESAGDDGVYVESADQKGVRVGDAGEDGVYVRQAGTPAAIGVSSGNNNGFEVAGAEGNGLWVGHADAAGVAVNSAEGSGLRVGHA
ncbi:MAG: hypothetical protein KGY78_10095, partial [Anaerolineae bacterium]|nr:hypothetical protein [Anaerolineae bacterium]